MAGFKIQVDDVNQLTVETRTGALEVILPTAQPGLSVTLRLSPAAVRQLWDLLGKAQQALETDIEGAPLSGARH